MLQNEMRIEKKGSRTKKVSASFFDGKIEENNGRDGS